jgi:hypothetical protein
MKISLDLRHNMTGNDFNMVVYYPKHEVTAHITYQTRPHIVCQARTQNF